MPRYDKGMFTFSEKAKEHTSNTHQLMMKVKLAQADLITRLSYLSGTYPISNTTADQLRSYLADNEFASKTVGINKQKDLNEFLNRLVDYLSYTCFRLYGVVEIKSSANDEPWQVSEEFMSTILDMNDTALDFVDKYSENPELIDSEVFKEDISKLYRTLDTRFSMEDKLVNAMNTRILAKIDNKQSDSLDDPDLNLSIDFEPRKPGH